MGLVCKTSPVGEMQTWWGIFILTSSLGQQNEAMQSLQGEKKLFQGLEPKAQHNMHGGAWMFLFSYGTVDFVS